MDDDELIQAARDNQPWAAPFLVSVYGPRLAGYCHSIAGDLGDTDRGLVIATAIERAVRRIDTYDPSRGTLMAWLRPFVRHASQDWRRSNARLTDIDDLTDILSASEPEAVTVKADPALVAALRDALPRLSDADQVIIMLRYYEGVEPRHIALMLEINADACRQRLHRATKRLRAILTADPRTRPIIGANP